MLVYALASLATVVFAVIYQSLAKLKNSKSVIGKIFYRFRNIAFLLSFLTLFVLSGFRVDVGIDYPSYVTLFNDIYTYSFSYFEPGFRFLITVIQLFTSDPQWLFITSSFITLGLIFLSIKKYSVSPALSVFLFCTMGFLSHSFNLTRQFIAIAIILYSLSFIVNGKFLKYALSVGIAALFHQTALIMLPIYFVLRMKIAPVYYLIITLLAGLFFAAKNLVINGVVLNLYPQYYDEGIIDDKIVSIYYIIICSSLAVSVIYFLHKKRISMKNSEERVMVNAIFLILLAHIFLVWLPLSNRVSLYLDIMLILFIPKLLTYIQTAFYRKAVIGIMLSYFIYAGYSSLLDNANGVLPYKSSLPDITIIAQPPKEGVA